MAVFSNVLDSFAVVGDRISLAHVFTGIGSDLRKLKQVTKTRHCKDVYQQWPPSGIKVDPASPSGIRQQSVANKAKAQLRKAEDDRWLQVEGGSPLRWRSCSACSFLCAEEDLRCEACGFLAPALCRDELNNSAVGARTDAGDDTASESDYTPRQKDTQRMLLTEVVVTEGATPVDSSKVLSPIVPDRPLEEIPAVKTAPSSPVSDESLGDVKSVLLDEDSDDEVVIPGTLDVAPQPGTLVKVLYDDEKWHVARVWTASDTKIKVCYRSGKQALLHLDVHAVRLADYISENEESEASEDEGVAHGDMEQDVNDPQQCEETADLKADDDDDDDEDSDSDGEAVPGTLDEAPAVGAVVKILHEDEEWYPAKITASKGTKAEVVYEDGQEEEVNFDENVIRPMDYSDEDRNAKKDRSTEALEEKVDTVGKPRIEHSLQSNAAEGVDNDYTGDQGTDMH